MAEEWANVKWSEARQVTRVLGWHGKAFDTGADVMPAAYFAALRASGRHQEAAEFLGQALPRWEAVAWAARAVRDLQADDVDEARVDALKAALLWVQDPTETRRRAAQEAASLASPTSPECFAALAAFYSGGSVAPPDCPALLAPRDAAGRFAAGAIVLAAAVRTDADAALDRCLTLGVALASDKATSDFGQYAYGEAVDE